MPRALKLIHKLGAVATAVALTAALGATDAARGAQLTNCPWLDQSLPVSQRVAELTAAMTLEQKISLMQLQPGTGAYAGFEHYVPPIPSLCVPAIVQQDGAAGVAGHATGVTQLPAPIAAAATFDTSTLYDYGATIGAEMRGKGIDDALAPTLNLVRVPEWGRAFESLGEDPFLTAQLGDADIEGIQSQGVIADVKHYADYNQETGRTPSPSSPLDVDVISARTQRETELSAFESAIEQAHAGGIMCAFPLINGIFTCQDPYLLTTVLRDQFGFKGYIRADNPAPLTSEIEAVNAGLDQAVAPHLDPTQLTGDVQDGAISATTINSAAAHILYPMFQLGIFNNPPTGSIADDVSTPADQAFALQTAEQGTVLLQNENALLPLRAGHLNSITVYGADASQSPVTVGGGSANVKADSIITPLQAIQARVGSGVSVSYSPSGGPPVPTLRARKKPMPRRRPVRDSNVHHVAIVFVGRFEGEGTDEQNLQLPQAENQLISSVARANKHTIVVLNTGTPVMMPWLHKVQAVIEAWYPGQEDGAAIAPVLFGDVNPSGKLPVTFPANGGQPLTAARSRWPGVHGEIHYSEGLDIGYRWYDAHHYQPLFPFGFGLSYTTFSFSRLRITPVRTQGLDPNGNPNQVVAVVHARLTNTGTLAGADVAQLYLGDPASTGEPLRQLRGFARIQLAPHRYAAVTLPLTARDLAYWNAYSNRWVTAPGSYRIYLGDSSALSTLPLRGALLLR
jgi:beta-glucosidase